MASVLHAQLRTVADRVYSEFVDDQPARDEECAAILTWQPGTVLPAICTRRSLLTKGGQINQDAGLLASVKTELRRRQASGLGRSGKDLSEHFEKAHYGWDPRLVRLLTATLFKTGMISVRYQGRDLTDPTEPQARPIFANRREFDKATFDLLAEVNWRDASALCSPLFGVQGGDTFERTAKIVQEQADQWNREAQLLATRCHDNNMPRNFGKTCEDVYEMLADVTKRGEPNARLRLCLECAERLKQKMPLLSKLKDFPFEEYRKLRTFVHMVGDWAASLSDEAARRWERLHGAIDADDLLDRWKQMREDHGFLLSRYQASYRDLHQKYQVAVGKATQDLQQHEAFQHSPDQAASHLARLKALVCEAKDPTPTEEDYRCPACRLSLVQMSLSSLTEVCRLIEAALDALLPKPPIERLKPLSLTHTVAKESDLDGLTDEVRRYWRKAQRPLQVNLKAEVKKEGE